MSYFKHVFQSLPNIMVFGDSKHDAFTYEHNLADSTITVEKNVKIKDDSLRISKTMYEQFCLGEFPFADKFEKYEIGLGNKHVYIQGNFVSRHTDRNRDNSENTLPHIATIVIFNIVGYTGGAFYIDDEEVKFPTPAKNSEGWVAVLFPYFKSHEVKKVISGKRISFTFPVYGRVKSEWIGVFDRNWTAPSVEETLNPGEYWGHSYNGDGTIKMVKKRGPRMFD